MDRTERIVRGLIESNLSLEDLNILCVMISECEVYNRKCGYSASAREANIIWNAIFEHCKINGLYGGQRV